MCSRRRRPEKLILHKLLTWLVVVGTRLPNSWVLSDSLNQLNGRIREKILWIEPRVSAMQLVRYTVINEPKKV